MSDSEKQIEQKKLATTIRHTATVVGMMCFTVVFLGWIAAFYTLFLFFGGKAEHRTFSGAFAVAILLTPILVGFGKFIDAAGEVLGQLMDDKIERDQADPPRTQTPSQSTDTPE